MRRVYVCERSLHFWREKRARRRAGCFHQKPSSSGLSQNGASLTNSYHACQIASGIPAGVQRPLSYNPLLLHDAKFQVPARQSLGRSHGLQRLAHGCGGHFHGCVRAATPNSKGNGNSQYPKALMLHPSWIENTSVWQGQISLSCEIHLLKDR